MTGICRGTEARIVWYNYKLEVREEVVFDFERNDFKMSLEISFTPFHYLFTCWRWPVVYVIFTS